MLFVSFHAETDNGYPRMWWNPVQFPRICGNCWFNFWTILDHCWFNLCNTSRKPESIASLILATVRLPTICTHLPPTAFPSMSRPSIRCAAVQRVASTIRRTPLGCLGDTSNTAFILRTCSAIISSAGPASAADPEDLLIWDHRRRPWFSASARSNKK